MLGWTNLQGNITLLGVKFNKINILSNDIYNKMIKVLT